MMVTVMATVAVAFAAPGEGGTGQENGQGNGLEKVTICHNGHTITVGAPGAAAHLAHHDGDDGDTEDACADEGTTPEPPGGTTPTLTTEADATAALGGTISDTATLSGATSAATGTITFTVYGPYDASVDPATELSDPCAVDDLVFSSDPLPIGAPDSQGNYVVESPEFEPLEVGRYQWIASYSGDAENEASETSCRDANEASVVSEGSSTGATQQNMTVAGEIGEPGSWRDR